MQRSQHRSAHQPPAILPSVAVCIATRGRRAWLIRLLRALERQDYRGELRVLVADNDVENRIGTSVVRAMRSGGYRWSLSVTPADIVGTSFAANVALQGGYDAGSDLIAMIDDDEVPVSGWISALVRGFDLYGVDMMGGPVEHRSFSGKNKPWVDPRRGMITREMLPDGKVDCLAGANNFAIRRAVLARYLPEPLPLSLGLIGGGDYYFFRKAAREGCAAGYSQSALVWEELSPRRARFMSVVRHGFSMGYRSAKVEMMLAGTANFHRMKRYAMAGVRACYAAWLFGWVLVQFLIGSRRKWQTLSKCIRQVGVCLGYFELGDDYYRTDRHI